MKTATAHSITNAFHHGLKELQKESGLIESCYPAGFIIPKGQRCGNRTGYQVFVKVCRYSEAHLKNFPDSGGLYSSP